MLPFQTESGKWKPMRFSLIPLPLAHHANGSLLVCPFVYGAKGAGGGGDIDSAASNAELKKTPSNLGVRLFD
jgi:hypothetical protein